ncbi:MAG: clan AA aspartic protease [Lutibacter sp.]|uniref:retropepsin-like aspartic protease n=1 Tax=Lutibacter sp. TaxID=1925666 RepID=UPI0017C301DC|nr:retropepsin-like aspartic protease [Lutibacter sp.]MBT8318338.1 retroviral-like aspartic protease family protein [Lutibacter sp.]NNJ59196.1 clan AA aspartic protease [Lutibacter sp.]
MKLNNILIRKGYTKIKLKKINTNHFELKATINGVKGRFILDTGASNSCVDIHLDGKFKLEVKDSETKAAGAGAIGIETKISTKNKLGLKGWRYHNCHLVLLDLTHVNTALTEHNADAVDGIIGADILEKGKAIIDYKNQLLYLKRLVYKF